MNIHDMTEQAYKNGYEAGLRDLINFLIHKSKGGVIKTIDIPEYIKEMTEVEK